MPKVSVIIPFYNRINWLSEAIQSVLDQTYNDFEIILIDDGSSDPIPSNLLTCDQRIRYIRQENKGPAAARNIGIDQTKGTYIAFLDSDDMFFPKKLKKQVAFMEENFDVILSHTSYTRINTEGKTIDEIRSGTFSGAVYPQILISCPIATPTVMLRKEFLGNELRFDESRQVGEDVVLWIQIAKNFRLAGIDEPLSKVRMHGSNTAYNSEAQLIAEKGMIDFISKSFDLPYTFRREMLSSKYYRLASIYLHKGHKFQYVKYVISSIVTWPINFKIYSYLSQGLVKHLQSRVPSGKNAPK